MPRHGVIIANTGSPDAPTPKAVREYLSEFLVDPRIRPMHPLVWGMILNAFILPKRGVASAHKYEQIWTDGGSPLKVHMESLARKLQGALGEGFAVRYAMSYGSPSMKGALEGLRDAGCEKVTVVALYPQSAYSTSYVVEDKLREGLDALGWEPEVGFVREYSERPLYYEAVARSISDAGFQPERDQLLMAFHSIPMKDIKAGDTYADQVELSGKMIAERLGAPDESWQVGFQSRFDKSRAWLGPTTTEVLGRLDGGRRLFVVTPNFSIDCLETLYDIEVELRDAWFAANPGANGADFIYVPCLNDSEAQVGLLRSIVEEGR